MKYIVYKYDFPNKKVYIGITSTTLEKRWKNGYRHCPRIENAIKKYGKKNIVRTILFENLSKEEAEQKEIQIIAEYKSNQKDFGYNIENGGKCSNRLNDETKQKISKKMIGIEKSEETKIKMSIAQKKVDRSGRDYTKLIQQGFHKGNIPWNKNKKGLQNHTEEWKQQISKKMKIYNKKNMKKVLCVETNIIYSSINEASKELKISQGNISMCLCGKRKTAGGFHWTVV